MTLPDPRGKSHMGSIPASRFAIMRSGLGLDEVPESTYLRLRMSAVEETAGAVPTKSGAEAHTQLRSGDHTKDRPAGQAVAALAASRSGGNLPQKTERS